MSMNRQQRRLLQRQGQMTEDGTAAPARRAGAGRASHPAGRRARPAGGPRPASSSTRSTWRCARWPGRPGPRPINYSTVVFITLAVLMALIFVLDLALLQAGHLPVQVATDV